MPTVTRVTGAGPTPIVKPMVTPKVGPIAAKAAELKALSLPTVKKTVETNILKYTGIIYGRPKIGKTTLLASFPEAIFLSSEPGSKGIDIFEFNSEGGGIRDWEFFLRAYELLVASGAGNPFKTVVIDTAGRLYEMCLEYIIKKMGIPDVGLAVDGKKDWGASWREIKREFLGHVQGLSHAGYGVWLTGHTKEETIEDYNGKDRVIVRPALSGQAREVIEPLVDFFFYAEYMRDRAMNVVRVLICEGDETLWAGARKTPNGPFPRYLPLLEVGGFNVIQDAFLGKPVGIDPSQLLPTLTTSPVAKELVKKHKVEEARERRGV